MAFDHLPRSHGTNEGGHTAALGVCKAPSSVLLWVGPRVSKPRLTRMEASRQWEKGGVPGDRLMPLPVAQLSICIWCTIFRDPITAGFSQGHLERCLQALLLLTVTGGCTWHFMDEAGRTKSPSTQESPTQLKNYSSLLLIAGMAFSNSEERKIQLRVGYGKHSEHVSYK